MPQEWATSFAEQGFISMAINTHDVDNGLGQAHYDRLNRGPLASYTLRGFMDREEYYFKAVYTRVVRAIDYLTSRPDWDGKTMILTGRSQGGGLSLVGAGLDQRVTGVVCAVPAMCEHGGHRFGRPSGWPRFVPNDERDYGKAWATAESGNGHGPVSEMVWKVSRYYDAVNFARRIKCPAVVNLGLNRYVRAAYHGLLGLQRASGTKKCRRLPGPRARRRSESRLPSRRADLRDGH